VNSELEQYGLAGIVIVGMAWFIMYLMKAHREEREDWRRSQERRDEDTNKSMRENTNVLAGLKALLENRK
jgi:hypothetical protein